MCSQNHPDYPQWVCDIVEQPNGCPQCKRVIEYADIESIGVKIPDETAVYDRSARALVITLCPKCSCKTGYTTKVDKFHLLLAVGSLFDHIEQQRQHTEGTSPFENVLGNAGAADAGNEDAGDARKPSEAEKQFRHRRARKRRKLSQPPKESEVRAFLNRLGRTSFKRRSKGFKQFMWDLGIDLEADAPESPGNGGDEDRGGDDDGATEDEDDEEGEA